MVEQFKKRVKFSWHKNKWSFILSFFAISFWKCIYIYMYFLITNLSCEIFLYKYKLTINITYLLYKYTLIVFKYMITVQNAIYKV